MERGEVMREREEGGRGVRERETQLVEPPQLRHQTS